MMDCRAPVTDFCHAVRPHEGQFEIRAESLMYLTLSLPLNAHLVLETAVHSMNKSQNCTGHA